MIRIKIEDDKDNTTVPPSNLEPSSCDAPLGKEETQGFNTPACIHIHSRRKRLCDADGISAKAAIDGIVNCGLLKDDSPQYVKEVTFSQEKCAKGQAEETIITIT